MLSVKDGVYPSCSLSILPHFCHRGSGTAEYPYLSDPLSAIKAQAQTDGTSVTSSTSDSDTNAAANAARGKSAALVFVTGQCFSRRATLTLTIFQRIPAKVIPMRYLLTTADHALRSARVCYWYVICSLLPTYLTWSIVEGNAGDRYGYSDLWIIDSFFLATISTSGTTETLWSVLIVSSYSY